MDFEDALKEAARRADRAVGRAMRRYRERGVTDEDDLTGVLMGNLDAELDGNISGLTWNTRIFRHRAGIANEEGVVGADMAIDIDLRLPDARYSKLILVQAKRIEPGVTMTAAAHRELVSQCKKMLSVTASSYVFDYAHSEMRCGSATRIAGSTDRELYKQCIWTSYRFFLEFFRCQIGDPTINIQSVEDDFLVPNLVKIAATPV